MKHLTKMEIYMKLSIEEILQEELKKELKKKQDNENAVINLLKDESNIYHLTVSPIKGFSLTYLEKSLNHLIKLMNEKLYGKRYKKQGNYMNGVAVLENSCGENPHFHIIIRDLKGDLENKCSVGDALEAVLPRIKTSFGDKTSKRLIGTKSYCLQNYFNDGSSRLEQYLAKEFAASPSMRISTRLNNIALLNEDGARFSC